MTRTHRPALRSPHPRSHAGARRAVLHHAARRPGRRRHQGRAAARRHDARASVPMPRGPRGLRLRRLLRQHQPQQAQHRPRPEEPRTIATRSCASSRRPTRSSRTRASASWTGSASATRRCTRATRASSTPPSAASATRAPARARTPTGRRSTSSRSRWAASSARRVRRARRACPCGASVGDSVPGHARRARHRLGGARARGGRARASSSTWRCTTRSSASARTSSTSTRATAALEPEGLRASGALPVRRLRDSGRRRRDRRADRRTTGTLLCDIIGRVDLIDDERIAATIFARVAQPRRRDRCHPELDDAAHDARGRRGAGRPRARRAGEHRRDIFADPHVKRAACWPRSSCRATIGASRSPAPAIKFTEHAGGHLPPPAAARRAPDEILAEVGIARSRWQEGELMTMRLRRSELATPGSQREDDHEGRGQRGADLVFLDLEDAVAPAQKERARAQRHRRAERARLGPQDARRARQRRAHRVGARRHDRRGRRRRHESRHHHRPQGEGAARRLVRRHAADVSSSASCVSEADRPRGADRGNGGARARRGDRRLLAAARSADPRRRRPVREPGHPRSDASAEPDACATRATSGTTPAPA